MSMTSRRPYLARAIYDWINDNGYTPYILVNAKGKGVVVPTEHVNEDGSIILNIAPAAVRDLQIDNDALMFNGSFGGVARDLYIPMAALMAVYAPENGQGIVFEAEPEVECEEAELESAEADEPAQAQPSEPATDPEPPKPSGRPTLKVVK